MILSRLPTGKTGATEGGCYKIAVDIVRKIKYNATSTKAIAKRGVEFVHPRFYLEVRILIAPDFGLGNRRAKYVVMEEKNTPKMRQTVLESIVRDRQAEQRRLHQFHGFMHQI